MKSIRVGIVGYGFATATFHAPLISSVPGLELAAVSTSDPAKVRQALPGVAVCGSADELFARSDLDVVVIPTPNDTHYALAVRALAAGKHVVVDKPFTTTVAQAEDLMHRAAKAGRILSVFHNRRWDAEFLTVREVLASGVLGRLTHFESHFDRFRPEVRDRWRENGGPGSGLWYDLGAHLLDQSLQLFGEPETLWLDLARQRDGALADDWFHAVLGYGPLRVILHGSVLVPRVGPRLLLHGTQGTYTKSGLDPQEDALKAGLRPGSPGWGVDPHPGTLTLSGPEGPVERLVTGVPGDYSRYYAALNDAIRGAGPVPVPAQDALAVIRLLEDGFRSAAEGRTVKPAR